ncbi:MAG: hypothetical protein B7X58_03170, partial [Marinobacter sp. 34-60-7]
MNHWLTAPVLIPLFGAIVQTIRAVGNDAIAGIEVLKESRRRLLNILQQLLVSPGAPRGTVVNTFNQGEPLGRGGHLISQRLMKGD